jgi:hypothetical protein
MFGSEGHDAEEGGACLSQEICRRLSGSNENFRCR